MLFRSSHFKKWQKSAKQGGGQSQYGKSGLQKELRECSEQSQVDNNEPDEVQMLIKCFESLGCFASVGTWKNENTQSKTV